MRIAKRACLLGLATLLLSALACTKPVDLTKDLAIVDVTTGWFDAGIVKDYEGNKNKLVPSIAFTLKNVSAATTIASVQINAVYHQVNDLKTEWGTTWVKGIGSDGLNPGAATGEIVLKSDRGYMSLQPRVQMLQNAQFVDAVVDLHGKVGAQQWVKLGTFRIDRQLLTH
jgi:hypothetical protein